MQRVEHRKLYPAVVYLKRKPRKSRTAAYIYDLFAAVQHIVYGETVEKVERRDAALVRYRRQVHDAVFLDEQVEIRLKFFRGRIVDRQAQRRRAGR